MLRSRIIYLILLLCAIGFYIFYGKYIAFLTLTLVCSLPIFLYALTLITSLGISIKFTNCKTITQKDISTDLQITVDNKAMLHIACAKLTVTSQNMFSEEKSKEQILFPLNAKQITVIETALLSRHCGNIEVELEKVKLYDFFRLTTHTKRLKHRLKLSVLPNVYEIGSDAVVSHLSDNESHDFSTTSPGNDPSQVFDYHEYSNGDRVKNINWKLSIRLDKLMVKEQSLPTSSAVCIMFELGDCKDKASRLSQIDAQIETFISISSWLISKEISSEIEWFNSTDFCGVNMKLLGAEDLFLPLDYLFTSKPHFTNILLEEVASRNIKPQVSHIIYLTNSLDNDVIKSLFTLKVTYDVSVVCVKKQDDVMSNDLLQALDVAEINLIEVTSSIVEASLQNISLYREK